MAGGATPAEGLPVGYVRVATLDGLVDQILSGELERPDEFEVVGARSAQNAARALVQEGA